MRDPNLSPSELAETFTMPSDGSVGSREKPGVRKSTRMRYNKEAYCYVDPSYLSSLSKPPAHVLAAFQEVLGPWAKDPDGTERLRLAVHPHFRRWCLYERAFIPKLGGNLWKVIWISMTDPVKGVLPSDLQNDPLKAHFAGVLGEYAEPTRADFEIIEKFNKKKYGVDAVEKEAGRWEEARDKANDALAKEREEAFLDENWFLAWDEANQAAGSGQYMRDSHCRTYAYRSNVERYRRIQKNGYVVVEKKTREEFARELAKETVKLLKPEDKLIVEELLASRLESLSEDEQESAKAAPPLTEAQGCQLAELAKANRDRVLASLNLRRKVKTL